MWETQLNIFDDNFQMKRTKLMGLESEFKNFYIQEGELIENMHSRLMHILNEFDEVGESLSNSKIVGKIFRAMMRRSRWESMINILETMQNTLGEFTHEEVFTHLLYFEEKLRQNGELKETALQTQKSPSRYYLSKTSSSSSFMNDQIITKMFEIMLNLEKEYNKERDEKGMTSIFFSYHKECHTTHDCFLVLLHKKK
jgi:hypothetical protein